MSKRVRVPKHVINKLVRMQRLMDQLVEVNEQVEGWLEANGIANAFDFAYDWREHPGYVILDMDGFIEKVESEINGRG